MENTADTKLPASPPLPAPTGSVADLAKRIPFRMVCHMSGEREHVLEYLNEPLNLACIIVTPYRHGSPGKGVKTFGINERKAKGFKTLAALLEANPQVSWKAALLYPPNDRTQARRPLSNDKQKGDPGVA